MTGERPARIVPAPVVLLAALALALLVGGAALAIVAGQDTTRAAEIRIRFSHFSPSQIVVPAGTTLTVTLVNDDPIDHEWIVGDAALHARHRTGTEPFHATRPTEVTIPALTTRTTTITFREPGRLQFICHLPGHEAYGMVGTLTVTDEP
jgi:uncharacterized cupredoxin-like copper-binding protein